MVGGRRQMAVILPIVTPDLWWSYTIQKLMIAVDSLMMLSVLLAADNTPSTALTFCEGKKKSASMVFWLSSLWFGLQAVQYVAYQLGVIANDDKAIVI